MGLSFSHLGLLLWVTKTRIISLSWTIVLSLSIQLSRPTGDKTARRSKEPQKAGLPVRDAVSSCAE